MRPEPRKKAPSLPWAAPFDEQHYKDLKRKTVMRLLITYLAPLILLAGYFFFQYDTMVSESRSLHLRAIAENQANTLDLFLTERLVNLSNVIDDPKFRPAPSSQELQADLRKLQKSSEAFVDIGFFDSSGVQTAYAGPYPSLEKRNYRSETWYTSLKEKPDNFVITDIYLGFRQQPHFTIAVSRVIDGQYIVLRATLSPEKLSDYISALEGSSEVFTSIVNKAGFYQVVTPHIGTPLETSSIVPPEAPRLGTDRVNLEGTSLTYAYSWLRTADWALTVQWSSPRAGGLLSGHGILIIAVSVVCVLLIFLIIINRARKLVDLQMESDRNRAQLEHAAKLASVGELAAGIAHEINNPLAVISEEAGLIKDLMNPEFGYPVTNAELIPHLDNISESVFRCRDITRKLLKFVRRTEIDLQQHDIHRLIDGVVDGLLGHEMAVSNIEIIRRYDRNIPRIITDGNQLQQVVLNIINNSVDAIQGPGTITVTTSCDNDMIHVGLADTGKGISPDQLDKIFLPFYTTKDVGKGTGLGLSVSFGIIRSLGGEIAVESTVGGGSTFTIKLPIQPGRVRT